MLNRITDPLISLLYPRFCGSCGAATERAADGAACRACWESTRVFGGVDDPLCEKCGLLLEGVHVGTSPNCRNCDDHHYDRAIAVGVYEKALAATVLQLKREPHVPRTAAGLLREAFDRIGGSTDVVVPVPLSRRRRVERGFNQAEVLAKVISRVTGLPVDDRSLARIRDTPMHRAAMDDKAREMTVANAFSITRPRLISGRNILLVDDLMTSGATVSNCARVLKKNGADKVVVLALARAV